MRKFWKISLIGMALFSTGIANLNQQTVKAYSTTNITDDTSTKTAISNISSYLGTVTVYPDAKSVYLYDSNGQIITNVNVSKNSNWAVDEVGTINGIKYYHVGTNRWISADNVYTYKLSLLTVKVSDKSYTKLVDAHGKTVTNRALSGGSIWKIDKVVEINNDKYYRVATNEFVKAGNVEIVK